MGRSTSFQVSPHFNRMRSPGAYFVDARASVFHGPSVPAGLAARPVQLSLPDDSLNDGIIPSLSHVWGEVIHVAKGDHLDVIGHFNAAEHDPPHYDWLVCGAPFFRGEFENLWQGVADFIKP